MSAGRVLRAQLPVLALITLALTACSDSDSSPTSAVDDTPSATASSDSTPSAEPSESTPSVTGPACADVWSDGATLPRAYLGCVSDSGELVPRDPLSCSSGQRIIRFDNRYYAVPGGTIHRAAKPLDVDADYRAAVARCRG